jgi:hypothetical protein
VVLEKPLGGSRREAVQAQLRECSRLEAATFAIARCKQDRDALCLEAPRHEQQRVTRGLVEPLGIVDQAQQRALLGSLGEKAEYGHRHEEAMLGARSLQSERPAERAPLGVRQRLDAREDRAQELMKRGERQLRLRLDAVACEHAHVAGPLESQVEQR